MTTFTKLGAVGLAAAAIAGCGMATASSTTTGTVTKQARKPSAAAKKIDANLVRAKEVYANQVSGPHSIQTLHRLGSDATLLSLLSQGNLSAARSYIKTEYWKVWYHWHVSRMKITRGSRVISEQGVVFAMPASHMTLRGTGGRNLGTLYVSMQDEIGMVRLFHRMHPQVQVVIRSKKTHQLRTSMYSAAFAKLPTSGSLKIHGLRYLVRSFPNKNWNGEPITVWILMRG